MFYHCQQVAVQFSKLKFYESKNITPVNESVVSASRTVNMFSGTGANVSLGSVSSDLNLCLSWDTTSCFSQWKWYLFKLCLVCQTDFASNPRKHCGYINCENRTSCIICSDFNYTTNSVSEMSNISFANPCYCCLAYTCDCVPKIINTSAQATVPGATVLYLFLKDNLGLRSRFSHQGFSTTVPTNINTNKPQTELPSLSPNPGKIISISNLASLPNQQMSPAFLKPTPSYSPTQVSLPFTLLQHRQM